MPSTSPVTPAKNPLDAFNPPAPSNVKSTSLFDKDTFIKLLVAQMKYQNPMSPTDPSAFMQQAATLANVESMQNLEKSQSSSLVWQKALSTSALIGKTVTGVDQTGNPFTGKVNQVTIDSGVVNLHSGKNVINFDTVAVIE